MRRVIPVLVALVVLVLFLATLGFLWWKARERPEVYEITRPVVADIVQKTVATGAINPRREVAIKPRVSGVVQRLAVEPGDLVALGDLIATIQVIPDSTALNAAMSQVETARIAAEDARRERDRAEELADRGAMSTRELEVARTTAELRSAEYAAAARALQIVREGAARGSGNLSTEVRSTVAGMVLSVDVEEGQSVIETNTFNEGTTVASVADMSDMIFEGLVDESDVGKIREGMPLRIKVGALQDQVFEGSLEYIAPKGIVQDGAVQFEIEAAIAVADEAFIRAGSSANADIVLDRRDQVLAIDEGVLVFDGDAVFVEVETGHQRFERRPVEVGLSDGILIEVVSGLDADTRLKGAPVAR